MAKDVLHAIKHARLALVLLVRSVNPVLTVFIFLKRCALNAQKTTVFLVIKTELQNACQVSISKKDPVSHAEAIASNALPS